jgi:hypothetical protein
MSKNKNLIIKLKRCGSRQPKRSKDYQSLIAASRQLLEEQRIFNETVLGLKPVTTSLNRQTSLPDPAERMESLESPFITLKDSLRNQKK